MDAAQWPQGIGVVKSVEAPRQVNEKKPRPQREQALNCPRCNSTNTKFCYYNNYSLTQPRYFCKTCRRYWTEGGSLRNVPVGGGSRKNKRSSSSPTVSTNPSKKPIPDLTTQNPKINGPQDLNLAYQPNPSLNVSSSHHIPNMEFLKNGVSSSRGLLSSFIPSIMPPLSDCGQIYSSGLNLHDYKPTLNFSLDGFVENGFSSNNLQGGVQETTNAKLFFPLEDLKQVSSTGDHHQFEQENREQGDHQSTGYWSGMLGGGSW